MKEILMYYTSGFWVWLGITIGIVIAGGIIADILKVFFDFIVRLIRGNTQHVCDCNSKEKEEKRASGTELAAFASAKATADLDIKGANNGGKKTK